MNNEDVQSQYLSLKISSTNEVCIFPLSLPSLAMYMFKHKQALLIYFFP